jgi:D-alanyl-lipoteichoic acid acyltransferase DltB (MBOAT superfamily)
LLFNSLEFAVFFAVCFGLYVLLPQRAQNYLLLVASYVFYGAWDWRFLTLIAFSTVLDFVLGLRLAETGDPVRRRRLVIISVVANLGILGFFKYAGFFADSLRAVLGQLGVSLPAYALDIVLPVGISFYTFQTLSYTIDVYRGRIVPTADLLDFALFVSFFPQLVAGPIERASHLLPQMQGPRRISGESLRVGAWLVLWGLFKKVVVADNLAPLVDAVYGPRAHPTGGEVLVATYAFAFQIYCDFSGYTDVARGVARMMGFDIMLNFNVPYAAASPAEFWRRWHISLSTWLRDYLYIPLGGNRHGRLRTHRNLGITMVLGGLWHGASWPFVLWGAYHGALLIVQRLLEPVLALIAPRGPMGRALWRLTGVALTFHAVCLGWVMFRAESATHFGRLLGLLTGALDPGQAGAWVLPFAVLVGPLVLWQLLQLVTKDLEPVLRWPLVPRALTYAIVALSILVLGEDGGEPFIYFQF